MSDVIAVWEQNQDPYFSNCRVTGEHTRGIAFLNIEPAEGVYTFIGEGAMIDAIGKLFDLKPNEVIRALSEGTQAQEKKLERAHAEADAWKSKFFNVREVMQAALDEEANASA